MTANISAAVCELLNSRNGLTRVLTPSDIHLENYSLKFANGILAACVEVKKVQWYQCELTHLAVHERYERRGLASSLLIEAEAKASELNARILQCTVCSNNGARIFFNSKGFAETAYFHNKKSGNNVVVMQKVLCKPR